MKQLIKTVLGEGNVNLDIPANAKVENVLYASPECVILIAEIEAPAAPVAAEAPAESAAPSV